MSDLSQHFETDDIFTSGMDITSSPANLELKISQQFGMYDRMALWQDYQRRRSWWFSNLHFWAIQHSGKLSWIKV